MTNPRPRFLFLLALAITTWLAVQPELPASLPGESWEGKHPNPVATEVHPTGAVCQYGPPKMDGSVFVVCWHGNHVSAGHGQLGDKL